MPPPLSVIIATRERPALLERTLACFAGFAPEVIERVVVDDASSPDSAAANQRLAAAAGAGYERFPEPRMQGAARNRGLALTTGGHAWFVDDDDRPPPAAIRDVLAAIADPALAGLLLVLPKRFTAGDLVLHETPRPRAGEPPAPRRYNGTGLDLQCSGTVYPRPLVEACRGFDESFYTAEDVDLFLRASRHADYVVLATEPVEFEIGHRRRISRSIVRSQVGKIQFVRKHWRSLPAAKTARYLLYTLLWAPLFGGFLLEWRIRRLRRARTAAR